METDHATRYATSASNNRAGQLDKSHVHGDTAFLLHPETTKLMQPYESMLDCSLRYGRTAAAHGTLLVDRPHYAPARFGIISTIDLYIGRPIKRQELRCVVPVDANPDDVEQNAVSFDEQELPHARSAPVSRVRSRFFPRFSACINEQLVKRRWWRKGIDEFP